MEPYIGFTLELPFPSRQSANESSDHGVSLGSDFFSLCLIYRFISLSLFSLSSFLFLIFLYLFPPFFFVFLFSFSYFRFSYFSFLIFYFLIFHICL